MNKKALTIGIAVYNIKEEYLRQCIESVIANSSPDLEIIIADDNSEEYCSQICREYAAADSRIIYIKNTENIGIGNIRNMIIDRASGEWIFFVDGDDMISSSLAQSFIGINGEYDLIIFDKFTFCNTDLIDTNRMEIISSASLIDLDMAMIYDMAIAAINRRAAVKKITPQFNLNPGSVCSNAYKRSFLKDNNLRFDGTLKTAEDSLFSTSVFLKNPKTAAYGEIMYYYRINPQSVTHKYDEHSKDVTDIYLTAVKKFIGQNFNEPEFIMKDFWKYRCTSAISDNFERNIFHPQNPKPYKERREDFKSLLSAEPYRTALAAAKISEYENHHMCLKLALSKRNQFFLLNICYKHKILFRIYGGLRRRINGFKRS